MHPPFSMVFFTTLAGAGQGMFLALFAGQILADVGLIPDAQSGLFFVLGSLLSLAFLGAGLFAAFFHLGHPERAWRTATQWRTSWMSREVIVLPVFMASVFAYGGAHYLGLSEETTLVIGTVGVILDFALWVCTGMIYACLRFLREWATPLTPANFIILGSASGFTLATAYATVAAPALVEFFGTWTVVLTVAGLFTRGWSLIRNARLKQKSTLQTAIGVHHPNITQRSMGHMGGSHNTREFFHGKTAMFIRQIKTITITLVFAIPLALVFAGLSGGALAMIPLAFVIQYAGLIAERWLFFAQANHPQNLYYQTVG